MDRVFVPLAKEPFLDFKLYGKTYELRRRERQWTEKNVRPGRHVTVSCGYSGERLEGTIGSVLTASLNDIFRFIDFKKIEPRAKTVQEAKAENLKTLGATEKYIAFEIELA
ncbi:MAG TPA: hypothetical protein VNG29_01005 [Candidatus Paceibacterota bacterium]|nr:hypothetical protein [Candidatus Paceibacterota bacterium]